MTTSLKSMIIIMPASVRGKYLSDFVEVLDSLLSDVDPRKIQAGSNTPLRWKCATCSEIFMARPNSICRNGGGGCPKLECRMRRRYKTNNAKFGWEKREKSQRIPRERPHVPEPHLDDEEIWGNPPDDLGLQMYQVSTLGRVRNVKSGKTRQNTISTDGYVGKMYQPGNKKYPDHVIVAKTFIPNPENHPTVNHINTIRSDNRVCNLEWMSRSEQNHSENLSGPVRHQPSRPIEQISLTGNVVKVWEKAGDAAVALGISKQNISAVCSGKRQTCKGFVWKFVDPNPDLEGENWKTLSLPLNRSVKVSDKGRIKNAYGWAHYGTLTRNGYYSVGISNDEKSNAFLMHRLVAMAFIEQMDTTKDMVNHIDGNRGNNVASNLEWVNNSENGLHAHNLKRKQVEKAHLCKHGCGNSFDEIEELQQHEGIIHKEGWRFFCDICSKGHPYLYHLRLHKLMVHDKVRPYSCLHCNKIYASNRSLKKHTTTIHGNEMNR